MKRITLPNIITAVRLIGAVCLIFAQNFTTAFFIILTVCGISDLIDGTVARLMHSTSEFGARLDSVADLTFYSVMMAKLLPVLFDRLPKSLLYAALCVLIIRLLSYGIAAAKYHKFASLHTYMNKVTGVFVFFVPYFIPTEFAVYYSVAVCSVAALASVEELMIHAVTDSYNSDIQSFAVWMMKNGKNIK